MSPADLRRLDKAMADSKEAMDAAIHALRQAQQRIANLERENADLHEKLTSLRRENAALAREQEPVCYCPKSDLEIGGRGHLADCDTALARAAVRAGRLS